MGHPNKKSAFRTRVDDILTEYAHAYYAANGFPAHLRMLKSGRYAVDGTQIHAGKPIQPHSYGYSLSELPDMTRNLWDNARSRRQTKLLVLIQRLMPIPIRKVINHD